VRAPAALTSTRTAFSGPSNMPHPPDPISRHLWRAPARLAGVCPERPRIEGGGSRPKLTRTPRSPLLCRMQCALWNGRRGFSPSARVKFREAYGADSRVRRVSLQLRIESPFEHLFRTAADCSPRSECGREVSLARFELRITLYPFSYSATLFQPERHGLTGSTSIPYITRFCR